MDKFGAITGRQYKLFQYVGDPNAERVLIIMGSGGETADETVEYLNERGAKVGVLKVRLYRPFSVQRFIEALPASVKAIAVLDRTKESGALGEPLYLDIVTALNEGLAAGLGQAQDDAEGCRRPLRAVLEGLHAGDGQGGLRQPGRAPSRRTISRWASRTTSPIPAWRAMPEFSTESDKVVRALFYGLGSDGTVGANKNSIKIIGENTDNYAQGYFVYDSKKAGAVTISHLRFGPKPIRSIYLVSKANFVACHQPIFLDRYDMLKDLVPGGTFLLNTHYSTDEIWDQLPRPAQEALIKKKLKFYVIDALTVAKATGMGARINTIMQTCFFALSGVLPREEAIEQIKYTIKKTYGKQGRGSGARRTSPRWTRRWPTCSRSRCPPRSPARKELPAPFTADAPKEIADTLGVIYGNCGESLPVSAFSPDGTFPTGTARYEKRNLALEIPVWDEKTCIQCGKCVVICPHACIRMKAYDAKHLQGAPATFKSTDARVAGVEGHEVDAPGGAGRLHRLLPLRRSLPGQEQDRGQAQGHQHAPAAADPLQRARELQLLPRPAGVRPPQAQGHASSASSR